MNLRRRTLGTRMNQASVQRIHPAGVPAFGNYSPAAMAGGLLAISGQVPVDADGNVIAPDDIGEQTRAVLARVDLLLQSARCDRDDLVRVGVYLTDPAHFAEMERLYGEWLAGSGAPARTTIIVQLRRPGVLIEIDALVRSRHD
jgi:2-iminobutanoate/2-iminopropanoate deaminase